MIFGTSKIGAYAEWGEDAATSRFQESNHERGFVEGIKSIVTKPVLMVGHLTSPDDMLENIEKGYCDIVGGTRASIADPFLPNKVDDGKCGRHPRVHWLQHVCQPV